MKQLFYSGLVFAIGGVGAHLSLAADFCGELLAPVNISAFAKAHRLPRGNTFRRVRGFARETFPIFTKICEANPDEEAALKATRFIAQANAGNIDCSYLGRNLGAKLVRGPRGSGRALAVSLKEEFKNQVDYLAAEKDRISRLIQNEQEFSQRRGPAAENGETVYFSGGGIFSRNLGGLDRWLENRQALLGGIEAIERSPAAVLTCSPRQPSSKWDAPAAAFVGAVGGSTAGGVSSANTGGAKK